MKRLLIIGAGGHGKVVADCAAATGRWTEIRFLDDRYPETKQVSDWAVIGRTDAWKEHSADEWDLLVALGDNRLRGELLDRLLEAGREAPVLVHPTAVISPRAELASGTVVFSRVVVNPDAVVGRGSILNTGCIVEHDCRLGEFVHISPGACLAGGASVEDRAWIGIGAVLKQEIRVGQDAVVGAGAAVVVDVPSGRTVVGVPAREISH